MHSVFEKIGDLSEGQTISKANYGFFNSPKNE